jgi:hypothetical protein
LIRKTKLFLVLFFAFAASVALYFSWTSPIGKTGKGKFKREFTIDENIDEKSMPYFPHFGQVSEMPCP